MTEEAEKRGPGRPPKRQQEMAAQRRRRNTDALGGFRGRLALDMTKLDTENFEYRWINNDPGRIEQLTQADDWEIVQDRDGELKQDATGMGSEVSIHAGVGASGSAVRAVLVRKLKEYQDEDRAAEQRQIDETEMGLRGGNVPGAQTSGANFYQPRDGGVSIRRGE